MNKRYLLERNKLLYQVITLNIHFHHHQKKSHIRIPFDNNNNHQAKIQHKLLRNNLKQSQQEEQRLVEYGKRIYKIDFEDPEKEYR